MLSPYIGRKRPEPPEVDSNPLESEAEFPGPPSKPAELLQNPILLQNSPETWNLQPAKITTTAQKILGELELAAARKAYTKSLQSSAKLFQGDLANFASKELNEFLGDQLRVKPRAKPGPLVRRIEHKDLVAPKLGRPPKPRFVSQPKGLAYLDKLKDTPRGRAYLEKLKRENREALDREFPIEPMEHPSKVKL